MVLDIILPILVELFTDPIKNYVVTPIKQHATYAFKCDSNLQELQEQVEQLQNKKDRLQKSVDDATRNGDHIFPNVTGWLAAAHNDIGEAVDIIKQKEEAKNKFFCGFFPSLKTRYQLSKKAEKKSLVIDGLCNEEGLDSISYRPPLQQIVEPSVYSREALPSRVLMLNQVMDALRDPNLEMIGVYGMGGVGKTRLAKEVLARAVQEKLFETVVMVAVSQTPELRRIQGEIADFLGIKFSSEEIPGRASELYRRLKNSNALIILDDLWQKLELNAIGIPSQGASKGHCKIMLTSRNRDLLSSEMRAQKLFPLETLKEAETLTLFQMSVAEAKDPQFHAIANQIAKRCGGLPLLIQMVATELTNKEFYEWSSKLNQLSAFGDEEIYEKVHKVLESSYENLHGKEIKSFFLLCALFGQSNIPIQYLLTHCMGLGLFKHIHTIEEARDKVFTMINKLKAKSLLLDGDMTGYVKMHDVVRDTALSISSRVQHAFVGAGKVRFEDGLHKDCSIISLQYCDVSELPVGFDCPETEIFLLSTEDLSLEIHDSFFIGIKKLKVIDVFGMRLVCLPSSFGSLPNLHTLCLRRCRLDNIAILGQLKHLELLSLENSNVVELPKEMENLTRLKLLDLRSCSNLRVIPCGVLSQLCSLEELYILNGFVWWGSDGNASLVELDDLSRLLTLEIEIPDPKMIPIGFKCFSQLRRYKISVGNMWDWDGHYEKSRTLKLKVVRGYHLEHCAELLLRENEDLYLDGVGGIESVFYQGFPQLKHIHVENDYDIHYLTKSASNVFPILESMYLGKLGRLEKICRGQLGVGSFGELQILKISNCDNLTSLFPYSSAKCLKQLREMEVECCESMEAVLGKDVYHNNEMIAFPQLSSLMLKKLPRLIGFCKLNEESEQTGLLFSSMVFFPNLTSLVVDGCRRVKRIFKASMVNSLMQLKKVGIKGCGLMEEILERKELEEIEEDSIKIVVFPSLDSLSLQFLSNLKWFSSGYSIEFPLLRELSIDCCNAMENFVGREPSSESTEEYLFNEMVAFTKLERMSISSMNSFKYLWDEHFIADDSFFKLKYIYIISCSKLSVIFPSTICTRFQRVEELWVSFCDNVVEIYQQIQFKDSYIPFLLSGIHIGYLPLLRHIWNKNEEWGSLSTFQNLESVYVQDCENLKYLFPASIGCGLLQLRHLLLEGCNQLEVVIAKHKDDENSDHSFQFPELATLVLRGLKEMRSLYEGLHTSEWPKLKSLNIQDCSNICLGKFIPNLEEMTINEQGMQTMHDGSGEFVG